MQVHRDPSRLPPFQKAVITIGTFDGVHLGHQKIIDALLQQAKQIGGESVIITFHPHPRKIISNTPLQLINTMDEKIALLEQRNVDHLVVVPFTSSFSEQSAEDYIEKFLIQQFHPHTIIIGYDHHFGKNRKGNFQLLEQKCSEYHYQLIEIPQHVLNEIAISSTKIRNALLQSDIETANQLLGYSFFFSGVVVKGDEIGRKLGYPTANLQYLDPDKIHLGHGVYAVMVTVEKVQYKGMMSIGNRPSFNDTTEKVEVHIFDFYKAIYGQVITVVVKKFLRRQERYNSLEELKMQLSKDKEQALSML
ncbi:MAG: bifunctional riboflavin kinase/FAD synthetase [Bacteroidota bacterium]|nr:bifunctional riboflavin kinase/FAD synthetase [Bacteroidota bacterium]